MDLIQGISVSGNFSFAVIEGCTVSINDRLDPYIRCYNAFYGIGSFNRLDSGDLFQLCIYAFVLLFSFIGNCIKGSDGGCEGIDLHSKLTRDLR